MPPRRLVLVSGLTLADYLLWNSSVGGGSGVLAMISGLSLVPLVLATAWLFVLSLARALTGRRQVLPVVTRATSRANEARLAPLRADGALPGDMAARAPRTTEPEHASSDKIAA